VSADVGAGKRIGAWIPWLFVAFFAVVIAVNGTMIWLALGSWTGLASNHAYDDGLTYNRNLDAAARQALLGWRPKLAVRADSAGGEVELRLADASGRPIPDAVAMVQFERPTSEGLDFKVTLQPAGVGVYRGRFDPAPAGAWNLHATIRRDGALFVHEQRLVLP
jgi:nitrogen fixation protein FixH